MDLLLQELGDGGDVIKLQNDLWVIFGFENVVYLACFGGNVEQDTPTLRNPNSQAFDWWGNALLMPNQNDIQFNSLTERALNNIPLTSQGRIKIQNSIESDLDVMSDYANITIQTQIVSDDRLEALINIVKPSNLTATQFIFIWDATLQELSVNGPINITKVGGVFDFTFDNSFN